MLTKMMGLKDALRKITIKALTPDLVWNMVKPFIRVAEFLRFQRSVSQQYRISDDEDTRRILGILKSPTVKHGPFKNLQYPDYVSFGSSVFPKIIGTYERELTGVMQVIVETDYSDIIDIGCAEGYYAVGLAYVKPEVTVYAYDTDPKAAEACRNLAKINGASDRVNVRGICTVDTLNEFVFAGRGLIICDCEGCEKELFTAETVWRLRNCDILIETHDFIYPGISTYLEQVFKDTHTLEIVQSIDDVQKVKYYNYPEAKDLSFRQKRILFGEGRPAIMEWCWFRVK